MLSLKVYTKLCLYLGISLLAAHMQAQADLISPEQSSAQERFQNNPKLIDQTDQYCANKSIDAACTLAGNVFEGGGQGKCVRELVDLKITLQCQRTESVSIDRQIPEQFSSKPPYPQVTDRFCAKLKAGASCKVELKHNAKTETYQGVCKQHQEQRGYRFMPDTQIVLSCEPIKPTPLRTYQALNPVKKLWQAW